jgi:hypothetical protein
VKGILMNSVFETKDPAPAKTAAILTLALAMGFPGPSAAQVALNPGQLDQLVGRIALYPDPLLAQVLTAATFSDEIPDAARWADGHSYLVGNSLADAIAEDQLPWDPSVVALLPFPSVLDMMASQVSWTRQLGDSVLGQRAEVMDAVQRMRQVANGYGYLQDWTQYRILVPGPGMIEILPLDPTFYFVPVYDPLIVFARPRAAGFVGVAFGPRIVVGAAFAPWGWGRSGFGWTTHTVLIDGRPWLRNRVNHGMYVHPYAAPHPSAGPRVEHHELRPSHPPRTEHSSGRRG